MRVLIVEDSAKQASLLLRLLTEEGHTADICTQGADALAQGKSGLYDLILLDGMLPDIDGLSVCKALRRDGVTTYILMLSARSELQDRVQGLEAGADDYQVKPYETEELLARIRVLLRRAANHGHIRVANLEIDLWQHQVLLNGKALEMTGREYSFLLHLMQKANQPVSRSELLTKVWDINYDPGSNVVDVMVSRLRDKLGPDAWMIETVRGYGYCLLSQRQL